MTKLSVPHDIAEMNARYQVQVDSAKVYDVAIKTPVQPALKLSKRFNNNVLIKREDLQPVFSFKIRGAYNKMAQLDKTQLDKGVITASAGNHAQGLAYSARHLKAAATIVMPKTTPQIKVDAVQAMGAHVVLEGYSYDESSAYAKQLALQENKTYVHAYDDPQVIAGQGTVAKEILEQCADVDMVFVPVGGGGLLAGMAAYIKAVNPAIQVIGVEPEDAACLQVAMETGERRILPEVGIFADGVAVAQIGEHTFEAIKHNIDGIVTVKTDEICAAVKDVFDDTRSIAEPAGALSIAGLKKYVDASGITGKSLVAIDSGANIDFDRLRYISERSEIGEGREAIISVTIDEKPGSFKRFCGLLGKRNITEFNYRYDDPVNAQIFVGVQIANRQAVDDLMAQLKAQGYAAIDMTDNELAKLHTRYMIGGKAPVSDEVVYRFAFPEKPGALMQFLDHLGERWNISMFHYRNHGAAYGRVLVGMQVPQDQRHLIEPALKELGYRYVEETANPAYSVFLGP